MTQQPEDPKVLDPARMNERERDLNSRRLDHIRELVEIKLKLATINKELFDAGHKVDFVCW